MAITKKRSNQVGVIEGLMRRLFPEVIRESRCSMCGRPYMEQPVRMPSKRFCSGDVELMLYELGKRPSKYVFQIGAWHFCNEGFLFGKLLDRNDLKDLVNIIAEVVEFEKGCQEVIQKNAVVKMSSRGRFNANE